MLLTPAMILCGISFRRNARWRKSWAFTWVAAGLAIPTFAIKGIVFYAFLAAMLVWNEAAAIKLWRAGNRE